MKYFSPSQFSATILLTFSVFLGFLGGCTNEVIKDTSVYLDRYVTQEDVSIGLIGIYKEGEQVAIDIYPDSEHAWYGSIEVKARIRHDSNYCSYDTGCRDSIDFEYFNAPSEVYLSPYGEANDKELPPFESECMSGCAPDGYFPEGAYFGQSELVHLSQEDLSQKNRIRVVFTAPMDAQYQVNLHNKSIEP